MKKICVSTYCEWTSYGSIMQAIGLKRTLETLGFESYIVKDTPAPPASIKFPFKVSFKFRMLLKNILNAWLFKYTKSRYLSCRNFIREHVDCIYYDDYRTLQKHAPEADYYIAGSDQIWHPALCKESFFLNFVAPHKRLTYAASMGSLNIPPENEELFSSYISQMETISVREDAIVEVLNRYTSKKINIHIDPSFLLDSSRWRQYEQEYPIEKPYILVYAIYWDKKFNNELKKLHQTTNYNIIALCSGFSSVWANQKVYDASPGQFLWLIDNAEAVVSSSFHGVALSLNLNKKFAAIINPESPSRIGDLLRRLGGPILSIAEIMNFDLSQYNSINVKIMEERAKSTEYLKEILHVEE